MKNRIESKVKDMKKISILLLVGTLFLVGCGNRTDSDDLTNAAAQVDGNGQPTGQGNPDLAAALAKILSVRVISDANTIPTGGTEDVAVITALITNDKNQGVAGQEVDFIATGGVLKEFDTVTDENGQAKATLTSSQDYDNQDITVSVIAGEFNGSVLVSASGSELSVAGPTAAVLGDNVELTFTLKAGNDKPITNQVVSFKSSAGNVLTPESAFTDSDGRVIVVASTANGADTISATALHGTAVVTHSFTVDADFLTFSDDVKNAEFPVGSINDLVVTWESGELPVVNQQLRFALTAGQRISPELVSTDAAGHATVTVTSSSAGPATITVEAADGSGPATQVSIEFVAVTPSKVAIDTSSSRVHTADKSTVTAIVTDANGNPVKNKEVVFSSADLKGGQLNPASAVTNSAGEASVTFTAGDQATEFNEIVLVAEVEGTTIKSNTSLTVVERVLNVTIGSSNLVALDSTNTQNTIAYVVQVADGGGTPLQDANVELSIRPTKYYKGRLVLVDNEGLTNSTGDPHWTAYAWGWSSHECNSEDANGNRILDAGEDFNGNGSLDPQDPSLLAPIGTTSDIATLQGGSLTTDDKGSGYFNLIYPVSSALWAEVEITARAQALGAEAEDAYITLLPMDGEVARKISDSPPNHTSPYGTVADCTIED